MNSPQYLIVKENDKITDIIKIRVVYKKEHTKVFRPKGSCSSNKKLGCYVDDYPLDKYLIKNSGKIIYYEQVKENLYSIIEEDTNLNIGQRVAPSKDNSIYLNICH